MDIHHEELVARGALVNAPPSIPHTRMEDANVILLFGCTGTGKTSFVNIASGSRMEVGKGVRSSTKYLESSGVFQVDNQPVVLVDCPGFNDTYLTETEILRRLAGYLVKAYESKYKIVGLLYFHKITDTRVGGASFRHMNMFKALCGNEALRNAVYVTNMWSDPPTEDQLLREQELCETDEFFGSPLANHAQIARHYNTQQSALDIIRKLLGRGHVITRLQSQLMVNNMPLESTDVGLVIGQDLEDDILKQQQDMAELMEEREKALRANDQNWLQRLEAQEERTREMEQRLMQQLQALKANQARKLGLTSQQVHPAPGRAIYLDESALRAQFEAKINERAQNSKAHDNRSHAYPSRQQDWDKQRDEETFREIARIKERTARSRRQVTGEAACETPAYNGSTMNGRAQNPKAHGNLYDSYPSRQQDWDKQRDEETLREIARIKETTARSRRQADRFGLRAAGEIAYSLVGTVVNAVDRIPGFNRNALLAFAGDTPDPGTHTHGSAMEDVANTFEPPFPTPGPGSKDRQYRREPTSSISGPYRPEGPGITWTIQGHPVTPEKRSQIHEGSRASDQQYQPPGHEQ